MCTTLGQGKKFVLNNHVLLWDGLIKDVLNKDVLFWDVLIKDVVSFDVLKHCTLKVHSKIQAILACIYRSCFRRICCNMQVSVKKAT